MDKFSFWQKWLFLVSLIITIFGILLALFNQTSIFNFLFNNQINSSFWNTDSNTPEIINFQNWIYGVLGATVAGWGIFMAFIAYYPFQKREKWSWNCLVCGMIVWFILDTSISIIFKVFFNACFNSLVLILVILPLIFTRKDFNNRGKA